MHKDQLPELHKKRYHAQQEAVDKARKILDKAGVKWIFATDEDVLTALEGDERLPLVWKEGGFDLIEDINDACIDNLMNSWGDCLSYAIDNTIGTEDEGE